jgi:hypothetical protein
VRLQCQTDRARRNRQTVKGGWYATYPIVLIPGDNEGTTGMSLNVLADHMHSDVAILTGRKLVSLMCSRQYAGSCWTDSQPPDWNLVTHTTLSARPLRL